LVFFFSSISSFAEKATSTCRTCYFYT